MIYRGVKQEDPVKRRNRQDVMKAILYTVFAVAAVAAVVMLVRQFGIA